MDRGVDYYTLLGLQTKRSDVILSSQDLRDAYKRALLLHHPDKKLINGALPQTATVDNVTFAYRTLSDPNARARYDRSLNISDNSVMSKDDGTHRTGLETVDLDALTFRPKTEIWTRACRCGDAQGHIVTEQDLENHVEDGEITVGCKGCSLWLRVLFGVET